LFSKEENKPAFYHPEVEGKPCYLKVDEVVREPGIKYFKVPKLGSYLAIKLSYNSCLYEDAFNEAVDDNLEVD
jgi:hypothetical protein